MQKHTLAKSVVVTFVVSVLTLAFMTLHPPNDRQPFIVQAASQRPPPGSEMTRSPGDDEQFGIEIEQLNNVDSQAPGQQSVTPQDDPPFYAETDWWASPYWGRQRPPDEDLGFTIEMEYPHPYAALEGDPVPGNYVDQCMHDETNHKVQCTGTIPASAPSDASASFSYNVVGTCALYPNPPSQVSFDFDIQWNDGQSSQPSKSYTVAPVPDLVMTNPRPADGATDVPIIASDGSSPMLEWDPAKELECSIFPMPDYYDTSYWVSLRAKGGTWKSLGPNCERKVQLSPSELPCSSNGDPVTWEWRIHAYDYKYGSCRTENPVETRFNFTAGSCRPEIEVKPKYGNAYFLQNISVNNPYKVEVDWNGSAFQTDAQPPYGDVIFNVNGTETTVKGEDWGVEHKIDMGSAFMADWSGGGNSLDIYASYTPPSGGQTVQSLHYTAQPIIFPFPEWAATLNVGPFSANLMEGAVTYENSVSYPEDPFEANVTVPSWIPYVGGRQAGILETQATGSVAASSAGSGKLGLGGQTGLGMGVDIIGTVDGEGNFSFGLGDGLRMDGSTFGLAISASFEKVVTLGDLIPGLRAAEDWWFIGWGIKKLNNLAKITGSLVPRVSIQAFFKQQGRDTWVFDGSVGRGEITAMIRGDLKLLEKLYAWAQGSGRPFVEINFPGNPDYLREVGIDLGISAGVRAWFYEKEFSRAITCSLPQAGCRQNEDAALMGLVGDGWEMVPRDYVDEDYNTFVGDQTVRRSSGVQSAPTTETPIVANVFSLSEPALAIHGGGSGADSRTLLYIHDDPAKPWGQGTEMMVTQWNGLAWSPPISLTDDLNLDFTPQVAYDSGGNAVAIWERSHTDTITDGLTLAFMQSMDIGAATWLTATQTWSPVSMLTEDNGMADFAPRLRRASDGTVLAMWETNDGHEMFGTAAHPLTYTYAIWGGAAWSTPVAALTGLTNTLGMDVALYAANEGALVYVRDADLVSTTVGTEIFHSLYDGTGWSTPQRLTDDDVSDTTPSLAYAADGTLKLLWVRGDDLVMLDGSWNMNDLQVVRAESLEAGFLAHTLVRSPEGHLALAWQSGHGGLTDLAYSIYDAAADRWSADQYLMQDDSLEISMAPVFATDGTLHIAYRKEQTEYVTETVVFSPTLTVTYTNVPRAGASDLYVLEHTVGRDLAISDLALAPAYPAPGDPVTLTAQAHNTGDLVAAPVVVQFSDEGTPVVTVTVSSGLTAGTSITATAQWTAPATIDAPHTLTAIVDPQGAIVEFDETNNTTTLEALGPRLVAEWARVIPSPQGISCTLSVTNAGSSPAQAPTPVYLRAGNAFTGTLLATGQLASDLAVGARTLVTVSLTDVTTLPVDPLAWMVASDPAEDLANAWPVELRALPDLTLSPHDVLAGGFGNLELYSRGPFTVTLHNAGPVTATNVTLSAWSEGLTGTLIYSETVPLVGPHHPATGTFNHAIGDAPLSLWLQVDPDNVIEEWDETNNLAVLNYAPVGSDTFYIYLPLVMRND